jgi:hypothetical protein
MIASKVAAIAGLGVALFPCTCDTRTVRVPYVHYACATVMFLILAFFCYAFLKRAKAKGHIRATARAAVYAVCGIAILLSIVTLAIDGISGGALSALDSRLTFHGETTGLVAFGISWLTASRVLPFLTREDERFSPLREKNPP